MAGPRRQHWQTLLAARGIENQAYVVDCNWVGTAGDGTQHTGDSRIVSPMGELLATASETPAPRDTGTPSPRRRCPRLPS